MESSVNFHRASDNLTKLLIKGSLKESDMLEEVKYDYSPQQVKRLDRVRATIKNLYNSVLFRIFSYVVMIGLSLLIVSVVKHKKLDMVIAPMFAVFITFVAHKFMYYAMDRGNLLPLAILAASAILGLVFVQYDLYCNMAGMVVAFIPAFYLEKKYVKQSDKVVWWKEMLKIFAGISIVLIVKHGINIMMPETLILDFLKYLFIGISMMMVIPWKFIKKKLKSKGNFSNNLINQTA